MHCMHGARCLQSKYPPIEGQANTSHQWAVRLLFYSLSVCECCDLQAFLCVRLSCISGYFGKMGRIGLGAAQIEPQPATASLVEWALTLEQEREEEPVRAGR